MEKDIDKIKKKAAKAAIAATTGASLMVGGMYDSADELLNPKPQVIDNAHVQSLVDVEQIDDKSVKSRLKRWISSLPVWVRATIVVPLWALGFIFIGVAYAVIKTYFSPFITAIAMIGLFSVILLLVTAFMGKTMLPNVPLKKFFNKRVMITVVSGVAGFILIDNVFSQIWEDYGSYSRLILFITLSITLITGLVQNYLNLKQTKLVITTNDGIYEQ